MPTHVLHRGDLFAGRYRVERCIGTGGMGAVYEAEHVDTERRVALKVLLPQSLVSEGARERFKQEARVAAKIRHRNIVDVLDAGVDDLTAMPYLVMELLHGEDLATRVARTGRMDPGEAVGLLAEVASALDCLHERQIVHRDLKPENLFLAKGADGRRTPKLLDFGVAKVIAEGKTSAFTQDAQGTPVYMAPEQFAEQIRISPATDIYALGMLAFTLLTGKQYWGPEIERGLNVFMLARIAEGGPREPASVRAARDGTDLPAAFDEWFSTITALTPGERFPTAGDAIEALADVFHVDAKAAWIGRDEPDPPSSRRLGPASLREGRAARAGYTPTPSPTSGLHSTPPIPLRRAPRSGRRAWIVAMSIAALSVAISLTITLRVVTREPERPPANGAPSISIASAITAPSVLDPPVPSGAVPTGTLTAETPPSSAPSVSSVEPASTAAAPPSKGASRVPPRPPASSATSPRKPKYTRD